MKWDIKKKFKIPFGPKTSGQGQNSKFKTDALFDLLLKNRGITTKNDREEFLQPNLDTITAETVGIEKKELDKAVKRIEKAIKDQEQIVVFGDYDVDGICASAILWETLHGKQANIMPYIPHRVDEGYGLSVAGIKNARSKIKNIALIITVDNGIVANEAVEFAKANGIDVIITDHHLPHEDEAHRKPAAYAIVHTTKLCGAGVAWVLAKEFLHNDKKLLNTHMTDHLIFAALATVADMVPLVNGNRAIVKYGLIELRKTTRVGLRALFEEAGIEQRSIETYQIGHVISPRLNAAGRMESAMDSLRLLCTRDVRRAKELANMLGEINKLRQEETLMATEHAIGQVANGLGQKSLPDGKPQMSKLLFIAHESYQQGVIGLVAGKLVERYYRPSIVIAIGDTQSKASVRSVRGFNIIEFLRTKSEHFVNVGGHPMAAGFTVETEKIAVLQQILEDAAAQVLTDAHLERRISVDCELPLEAVSQDLYVALQALSPFGIGNPEPVFCSKTVIKDIRIMGRDGKHIKLRLSPATYKIPDTKYEIEAVGFGMGERVGEIKVGTEIDVAYTVDENQWNGRKSLQLKLKDLNY
ncbi:MAG: single-stranded-DNA-specific exonuclease RecJ [bacterium]|nr:single-stranded-DNA-specific exonuclease RecJ [bacterium]